jgi:hypothetical protein
LIICILAKILKCTLNLTFEKEGSKSRASIVGAELTKKALGNIAINYFKLNYNIELSKDENGVVLNYPSGFQYNQFQFYSTERERYVDYEPRGESAAILACGNVL